jgi:ATP-dependent Zn protease
MNELWSFIISWTPFVILIGLWYLWGGRSMRKVTERSREALELQRRILACLEEIKAELKGLNAAKES